MLDQFVRGKSIESKLVKIPPLGVATRVSTVAVAVADPRLASAGRYLRDHACEPLQITEVAKASGLSRTVLERMRRKQLGVSPYEQVLRYRMARADLLLTNSTLTIAEIAARVGFTTVEHFTTTYTRRTGKSPGSTQRRRG